MSDETKTTNHRAEAEKLLVTYSPSDPEHEVRLAALGIGHTLLAIHDLLAGRTCPNPAAGAPRSDAEPSQVSVDPEVENGPQTGAQGRIGWLRPAPDRDYRWLVIEVEGGWNNWLRDRADRIEADRGWEAADEMERIWVYEKRTLGMATDNWLRDRADRIEADRGCAADHAPHTDQEDHDG